MTLDDLRAEWASRDRALQDALTKQTSLMRALVSENELRKIRAKSGMNPFELVIFIAFLVGFGACMGTNWGRWEFFIPALLLHIWTIAMGAFTFSQRARLLAVDFSAPVLDIQKRLAALRNERARGFQWAFLTGQVLWWIPFVTVLFWGVFGVNLYTLSEFTPRFMAINIMVGVALVPIGLWVAHMVGPRLAASKFGRSMIDAVTGRDLAEARALADRLRQFEAGV